MRWRTLRRLSVPVALDQCSWRSGALILSSQDAIGVSMVPGREATRARLVKALTTGVRFLVLVVGLAIVALLSLGGSAEAHADVPRVPATNVASQSSDLFELTSAVSVRPAASRSELSRECPGEDGDGRCCAAVCAAVCHAAADLVNGWRAGASIRKASLLPDPGQPSGSTVLHDLLRPPRT